MSDTEENKMEKTNELILDISKGASFSSSAMQQFVELQSEVDAQAHTISYLRRNNDEKDQNFKTLEQEHEKTLDLVGDLNSRITKMHERESQLADREAQITRLEMTAAYEEKRREDHQVMVGLIFRNTELRKRSFGEEQQYQPGCMEIKDEYGNIKQYAETSGFVGVPVKKEEVETPE